MTRIVVKVPPTPVPAPRRSPRGRACNRRRREGFTLVEAVCSVVLVSVLFVAAVQAVSLPSVMQFKSADRARGRALATALLNEIVQQKYAATSQSSGLIELLLGSSSSTSSTNRLSFDDVDDYHNYIDSPPVNRDGSAIPGAGRYTRRVIVMRVSLSDLSSASASETGAKLITVTVTRDGVPVATMSALRTNVP